MFLINFTFDTQNYFKIKDINYYCKYFDIKLLRYDLSSSIQNLENYFDAPITQRLIKILYKSFLNIKI